jgi:hypothetical protein
MFTKYKLEAQKIVDALFGEHQIPFKLEAHKVTDEGYEECRIHFYDSRLRSVVINTGSDVPFKDQVVAGILLRLNGYGKAAPTTLTTDVSRILRAA